MSDYGWIGAGVVAASVFGLLGDALDWLGQWASFSQNMALVIAQSGYTWHLAHAVRRAWREPARRAVQWLGNLTGVAVGALAAFALAALLVFASDAEGGDFMLAVTFAVGFWNSVFVWDAIRAHAKHRPDDPLPSRIGDFAVKSAGVLVILALAIALRSSPLIGSEHALSAELSRLTRDLLIAVTVLLLPEAAWLTYTRHRDNQKKVPTSASPDCDRPHRPVWVLPLAFLIVCLSRRRRP